MKSLNKTRNDLLKRDEISLALEHTSTPSMAEATKLLSENLKVAAEMVVVKDIRNKYGSREFIVRAFVYDSADGKQKVEPRPKEKKSAAGGAS